jgi:hypothetical protein
MYYILKERRIIKHFAVIAEEVLRKWDQAKKIKQNSKKNSLLKNRKGDFSLRVRALNHIIIFCLLPAYLNNAITRAQREKDIRA